MSWPDYPRYHLRNLIRIAKHAKADEIFPFFLIAVLGAARHVRHLEAGAKLPWPSSSIRSLSSVSKGSELVVGWHRRTRRSQKAACVANHSIASISRSIVAHWLYTSVKLCSCC